MPRRTRWCSVGDSAAWIVGGGGVDDLTLGQRKARLGSGRAAPVSFRRDGLDGTLVVGTDGLFKYATPSGIGEAVRDRSPEEAAERLVEVVRLPSGAFQDDVAVVVVARKF
jgi:PPM family protein phosphatase